MEVIATWSAADRRSLFTSVASDPRGVLPRPVAVEVVEKDAWVCFALQRIFRLYPPAPTTGEPAIVFKGGTSLSKAFGLIHRFSEDIDLTIDPAIFGGRHPAPGASRSEAERHLTALGQRCDEFVSGELRDALERDFASHLGGSGWLIPDPEDRSTLLFAYPTPSGAATGYVAPTVRLEFGARSDREPWSVRSIVAYAAQARPEAELGGPFDVPVLTAERTFWEKATILHAENARARRSDSNAGSVRVRNSRHVSDLAAMASSVVAASAIADEPLLRRVCECKQSRFRTSHVVYATIRRRTIEITPRGRLEAALSTDYAAMKSMFFDEPPTWASVLQQFAELETRIRAADPAPP